MLIDDRAISQSEHSGLFYKSAGGTVFIGSGTTRWSCLPSGQRTSWPLKLMRMAPGAVKKVTSPFAPVGLIPDIEAHPTIAGIRAGKDEILDRAITYIEKGK